MKTSFGTLFVLIATITSPAFGQTEFRLSKDGVGPIVIVAEVSISGRDAILKTSARNDSGQPIRFAKFCVAAEGRTKGCDFELWTTATWKPGEELTWMPLKGRARAGIDKATVTMLEFDTAVILPPPLARPDTVQSIQTPSASAQQDVAKSVPIAFSFRSIRAIYVDQLDNDLDEYIKAELAKQMKNRITVVLRREDADAIITGVSESKDGLKATITGRYLGLHDTATASISLVDKDERVVLWSSEAGDRNLWLGWLSRGGPRKVADRLVSDLKSAFDKNQPINALSLKPISITGENLPQQEPAGETKAPVITGVLTNEDIGALKQAGLSDEVILAKIKTSKGFYKIDTDGIIALKKLEVSDAIILAMIEAQGR